jgi:hypothetical protein
MLFLYVSFFCIPKCLTCMSLLCADVGPVRPMDFSRNRQRPRLEVGVVGVIGLVGAAGGPLACEVERLLRRAERNLISLTCAVPMEEIEDLPPSMQPHVVGVPRNWVQLFRHLENVVVHYDWANRPCP